MAKQLKGHKGGVCQFHLRANVRREEMLGNAGTPPERLHGNASGGERRGASWQGCWMQVMLCGWSLTQQEWGGGVLCMGRWWKEPEKGWKSRNEDDGVFLLFMYLVPGIELMTRAFQVGTVSLSYILSPY